MTSTSDSTSNQAAHPGSALLLLRALFHLAAIASVTAWGLVKWPLPFPGLLIGAAFFVLSVLTWALFLSPRPVLRTDRFAQALIELLLLGTAVGALLSFGIFWVWVGLFGIIAAVVGYLASTRTH